MQLYNGDGEFDLSGSRATADKQVLWKEQKQELLLGNGKVGLRGTWSQYSQLQKQTSSVKSLMSTIAVLSQQMSHRVPPHACFFCLEAFVYLFYFFSTRLLS